MYNTREQEAALTRYLGWHGNWVKVTHDKKGNATGSNKQGVKVTISPDGRLLRRSLRGVKPRYISGPHTDARLRGIRAKSRRQYHAGSVKRLERSRANLKSAVSRL